MQGCALSTRRALRISLKKVSNALRTHLLNGKNKGATDRMQHNIISQANKAIVNSIIAYAPEIPLSYDKLHGPLFELNPGKFNTDFKIQIFYFLVILQKDALY